MSRGPLFEQDYRPQFSGHETFPLKYGWLKKAVDAVLSREDSIGNRSIFLSDDAIGRFGVGKNMVAAIRFWAEAASVITSADSKGQITVTPLGRAMFGVDGWDPYMESPISAWVVHWNLSGCPGRTTWFWVFSHLPVVNFDREFLLNSLLVTAKEAGWHKVSEPTVKRDVDCFIRSYCPKPKTTKSSHERDLESPLVELGLIRPTGKKDGFRMVNGTKKTLGPGVFLYALMDFWNRYASGAVARRNTLSFEAIAHEPGSPGRVFLLDDGDLIDRLSQLEETTSGALQWSETAGLKQVIRHREISEQELFTCISSDYKAEATNTLVVA